MLFDQRTYTCRPGTIKQHMALYEEHGLAAQKRHLGEPLLYAITETGNVNQYVHIWAYADAADRAKKRQAMTDDPDWQAFLKMSAEAGYLVAQENKLLAPTSFYSTPQGVGRTG